jgi:lipid A ethanolaminephosphotransferase
LHGAPYFIAPPQQTHVPFLVWLSQDLQTSAGYDMTCLAKNANGQHSHDNFFHSVLGLMEVATKIYQPELDIFSGCREGRANLAS